MWFKANNLFMNLKKTHFMQIRKSFYSTHFWNIYLNHPDAKAVTRTSTHKFLGVTITIDEMLNWKECIDKLALDLCSLGYVFRKLVMYSDVQTVKIAYYVYVYSKLKYGVLAWGCSFKENIDRVFKKQ